MARPKRKAAALPGNGPITKSRARRQGRPDVPSCGPRPSLPLPAELVQHILFLVSEPIYEDGSRFWPKFNGERRVVGQSPTDIQNARLVCKTFAVLGAPCLFKKLYIAADRDQLAHVRYVSQHPQLSKGVRTLVYDCSTYEDDRRDPFADASNHEQYYQTFFDWIKDRRSKGSRWLRRFRDQAAARGTPSSTGEPGAEGFLSARRRLYAEQEEILREGLDTECLTAAFAALPAINKIVCSAGQHWGTLHRAPAGIASMDRCSNCPDDGDPNISFPSPPYAADTRPLYSLCAALLASGHAPRIRTLDLRLHVSLLADETRAPRRWADLLAVLAHVRDLTLALSTRHAPPRADLRGADPPALSSPTALIHTGALGRLLSATPPDLARLKLTLCPVGQRRSGHAPYRFDAPLAAYLGAAAAATTTDTAAPIHWRRLRYLHLGCLDAREDELVPFVLARRGSLECVEFDRVCLTQGQWCVVGAAVDAALPWRWRKQCNLTQVDGKRERVRVPEEVLDVAREVRAARGGEVAARWVERHRVVDADQCYFEAVEEMSTYTRQWEGWESS